jgi:RNA polymerase sigma-70 factor (ECF subfamily)
VTDPVDAAVAAAFHEEWGRIVATLIGLTGDWDLAEECAQDAFARALETWPRDGVPRNPGAWLTTIGRNRAVDRLRRARVGAGKEREQVTDAWADASDDVVVGDERLRLIFTCCHPALRLDARVALTLRTLTGLTTAEIARAFLVPEPTMAKRLVRAKTKIRNAGIPYRVPPEHAWPERLGGVLAVVYLLFNEGYHASAGADVMRRQLSDEAIRLGHALATLMPDEPEVGGLLALMLMHDARRDARVDGHGDLVTLEDQDRSRWDRSEIAEGVALLDAALRRRTPGPYQLQAQIVRSHVTASDAGATDWHEIVARYDELSAWMPTPVVALNRAIAVAMADGPDAGLALVDDLVASGLLAGYPMLSATRADLLRRAGRDADAAAEYREAIVLARTDDEARYLRRRLSEVHPGG